MFNKLLENIYRRINEAIIFTDKDIGIYIKGELIKKDIGEYYGKMAELIKRIPSRRKDKIIRELNSVEQRFGGKPIDEVWKDLTDEQRGIQDDVVSELQQYTKSNLAWIYDENNNIRLCREEDMDKYTDIY